MVTFPSPRLGISQVRSITTLGVVLYDKFTAEDHASSILTSCLSSVYALRVLRDYGRPASSLQDVFRSTILAKIRYCPPAWSGLSARQVIVQDRMHSYDVARNMATVLMMFRRRLLISLLQLTVTVQASSQQRTLRASAAAA